MTGYRSKYFRHSCEEKGCYITGLPDWTELIERLPRRIRPTDIDGMIEIGGQVLILEEKCKGKGPDEGQRRAFLTLASVPTITVVLFRPGESMDLEVLVFYGTPPQGWKPCSRESFYRAIEGWAMRADAEDRAA